MHRLFPRVVRQLPKPHRLAAVLVGIVAFSAVGAVHAQTTVYTDQYGNPTVTVDLDVLDRLGPEQNLPELYRKTAPLPSRPVMATTTPSAPSGGRGLLAPPPQSMPRSQLNIPNEALPARPPAAASRNPLARSPLLGRGAPEKPVSPPGPARLTREVSPPTPARVGTVTSAPQPPQSRPAPVAPPKVAARPPAAAPTLAPPPLAPPPAPSAPPAIKPPAAVQPPPLAKAAPPTPPAAVIRPLAPPAAAPTPRAVPPRPAAPPPLSAPQQTNRPQPSATAALTPPARPSLQAAPAASIAISPDGNLYSIPFATGSTDLPKTANPALAKLAERMKQNEDLRIQLMGFAGDDGGSASQARRSSLFRALAIRTFLMKEGIRSTRMDVRALGQTSVEGVPPDRVDIIVQQ